MTPPPVEDILDPFTDEVLIPSGAEIDEKGVKILEDAGITHAKIRSVLTCQTKHGVCAACYGRDLSHGHRVEIGQAIGILSAQSALTQARNSLALATYSFQVAKSQLRKATTIDIN